jgi:hypothetical protein
MTLARDLERARQQLARDLHPQLQRLSDGHGHRLFGSGNTIHVLTDLVRTLVTAGLSIHDCADDQSTGGVCLTPQPRSGEVTASWSTHRVMPRDATMATAYLDTHEAMTDALAAVLEADGWTVRRTADGEGVIVTDGTNINDRGDEAG